MTKDPVLARKYLYIATTLFGAIVSYLLFKQVVDEKTAGVWMSTFNIVAGALITGGPATATYMLSNQIKNGVSLKPVEGLPAAPLEEVVVNGAKELVDRKNEIVAKTDNVVATVADTFGFLAAATPTTADDDLFKRAQAVLNGD